MLFVSLIAGVVLTILPHSYHRILLKFHKAPQIPTSKKQQYIEHINSNQWRKIRQKRLAKDRFICQNCSVMRVLIGFIIKPKLEVHHKNYRNLGNEKQRDLITLCKRCHSEIHKRK